MAPNSYQFSARNDAIVNRGYHDEATDTSVETRKLEGKLDGLVNVVTHLGANQKPTSFARIYGIRSSNDHNTSVCPSSQQSGVDDHPEAYAANTYSRPPQQQRQGVHDVATDTSAETTKLEGKLDALVNLQSGVDGHPEAYDANTNRRPPQQQRQALDREDGSQLLAQCSASNDAIVIRGVHDVAIDTSAETRKLECKLDALVNLVTQLAANQKPASVARVCGIRSSNDHHTSVCPSSQQSGADEHPKQFIARNDSIFIRGVHDVATDTSAETGKLECKLHALVNLVTQLAANQKPSSVARVCDIRSSNCHHSSVCPESWQSGLDENPEAYGANTYSRQPQQQIQGT
ncbi:hypothetical protein Fmac_028680 [Flemingia macrophylla]|uniref:Uncharacterized protein n=1 Tax=Flemingia macrophylla TaxID=520843 RepID=A0ABD1L895_9FABA